MKQVKLSPTKYNDMADVANPDAWAWQQSGLCRQADASLYFSDDDERGLIKEGKIKQAILICNQCSVLNECKEFALKTKQQYGIWGGLTEEQLNSERRKRGRSSKSPS